MKILQIGKFFPPYFFGGIETVSNNLHNALQQVEDVEADFLGFLPKSFKNDIRVDEHIYLCKTDIDKFSAQLSRSFNKKYKAIRNNYDIIIVNLPHPVANLAILKYPTKAKIVLYWHSDIVKQKKLLKLYKPFLVKMIKKASAIIGPTSVHVDESDFSRYFEEQKKFVLPYLLNYETNPALYKKDENNKKIILSCGRLIYYKGFNVLVEAAKYIDDSAVIHIVGTGKLHEALEKQIRENKLENKVFLLGRLSEEELKEEYKNCYLYCFPSLERGEMMGMVQFEAFSYGKPIVSANIPRSGAPTLNEEGVTGFKVPINDPCSLAEKINILLLDTELYSKFCKNAALASEHFNSEKIIDGYMSCFHNIMKIVDNM